MAAEAADSAIDVPVLVGKASQQSDSGRWDGMRRGCTPGWLAQAASHMAMKGPREFGSVRTAPELRQRELLAEHVDADSASCGASLYRCEPIGRRMRATKLRHAWTLHLAGEEAETRVELLHSRLTGKKEVLVDGRRVYETRERSLRCSWMHASSRLTLRSENGRHQLLCEDTLEQGASDTACESDFEAGSEAEEEAGEWLEAFKASEGEADTSTPRAAGSRRPPREPWDRSKSSSGASGDAAAGLSVGDDSTVGVGTGELPWPLILRPAPHATEHSWEEPAGMSTRGTSPRSTALPMRAALSAAIPRDGWGTSSSSSTALRSSQAPASRQPDSSSAVELSWLCAGQGGFPEPAGAELAAGRGSCREPGTSPSSSRSNGGLPTPALVVNLRELASSELSPVSPGDDAGGRPAAPGAELSTADMKDAVPTSRPLTWPSTGTSPARADAGDAAAESRAEENARLHALLGVRDAQIAALRGQLRLCGASAGPGSLDSGASGSGPTFQEQVSETATATMTSSRLEASSALSGRGRGHLVAELPRTHSPSPRRQKASMSVSASAADGTPPRRPVDRRSLDGPPTAIPRPVSATPLSTRQREDSKVQTPIAVRAAPSLDDEELDVTRRRGAAAPGSAVRGTATPGITAPGGLSSLCVPQVWPASAGRPEGVSATARRVPVEVHVETMTSEDRRSRVGSTPPCLPSPRRPSLSGLERFGRGRGPPSAGHFTARPSTPRRKPSVPPGAPEDSRSRAASAQGRAPRASHAAALGVQASSLNLPQQRHWQGPNGAPWPLLTPPHGPQYWLPHGPGDLNHAPLAMGMLAMAPPAGPSSHAIRPQHLAVPVPGHGHLLGSSPARQSAGAASCL
mmetsp:Transcript_15373/g.33800  ORF Transcript_15373/g.33800 Transcript_15373/m.33800 type:complete len:861 (-) Transcript_15373:119-2701(-)